MVHPETGETVYCRGYASASSPGYDILLPMAVQAGEQGKKSLGELAVNVGPGQAIADNPAVTNGRSPQVNPAAIAQKDAAFHTALFGQRP
jgi:hypothetical protein